jgi:hypothetical protein
MANWCFNSVRFTGEPDNIQKVMDEFQNLQMQEMDTEKGQLPDFISGETNYFFELYVRTRRVNFVTRWIPPVEIMVEIGRYYSVDFEFDFEEIANGICGKAFYRNGKATIFNLSHADFAAYDYDEKKRKYRFEGKYYASCETIFKIMLKRKMTNVDL